MLTIPILELDTASSLIELFADLEIAFGAGSGSFAAVILDVALAITEAGDGQAGGYASFDAENERWVSESAGFCGVCALLKVRMGVDPGAGVNVF